MPALARVVIGCADVEGTTGGARRVGGGAAGEVEGGDAVGASVEESGASRMDSATVAAERGTEVAECDAMSTGSRGKAALWPDGSAAMVVVLDASVAGMAADRGAAAGDARCACGQLVAAARWRRDILGRLVDGESWWCAWQGRANRLRKREDGIVEENTTGQKNSSGDGTKALIANVVRGGTQGRRRAVIEQRVCVGLWRWCLDNRGIRIREDGNMRVGSRRVARRGWRADVVDTVVG